MEEQYILARKLHMGIGETNLLADFERQVLIRLWQQEQEEIKKQYDKVDNKR